MVLTVDRHKNISIEQERGKETRQERFKTPRALQIKETQKRIFIIKRNSKWRGISPICHFFFFFNSFLSLPLMMCLVLSINFQIELRLLLLIPIPSSMCVHAYKSHSLCLTTSVYSDWNWQAEPLINWTFEVHSVASIWSSSRWCHCQFEERGELTWTSLFYSSTAHSSSHCQSIKNRWRREIYFIVWQKSETFNNKLL
jgi:hypothetical protein